MNQAAARPSRPCGAFATGLAAGRGTAGCYARDESEFYLLISDEVKDPSGRRTFVRMAVRASGKN